MSVFHYDQANLPTATALKVEIPAQLTTADDLLLALYRLLRFPDYFGMNWNALYDCITDFSWLPPGPIVIIHRDLPIPELKADLKSYLSVLSAAADKHLALPDQSMPDVYVVFPPEHKARIEQVLADYKAQQL